MEFESPSLKATTMKAPVVEVEVLEWVEAVASRSTLLLLRIQRVLAIVKLSTHLCWG